jgi:mRNA interferase MazF
VVSQLAVVDKADLSQALGTLSDERVAQILAGLAFLQRSFFQR